MEFKELKACTKLENMEDKNRKNLNEFLEN